MTEHSTPPAARDESSRLSRFLALVLRHKAYRFDLFVDDHGYVDLEDLLDVINEQEGLEDVEEEDIRAVGQGHTRTRFEIKDGRIRATYGHSFRKPVHYERVDPPEELYIALPQGQVETARAAGLKPAGRQYVHLSKDKEDAEEVGRRWGEPYKVITVRAKEAGDNGISFHNPTDGLFLALSVPAKYLNIQVSYGRSARRMRRGR